MHVDIARRRDVRVAKKLLSGFQASRFRVDDASDRVPDEMKARASRRLE